MSEWMGTEATLRTVFSTRLKNSKVVPKNEVTVCPTLSKVLSELSTCAKQMMSAAK
jgi:hypothetical protein